MYFILKFTLYLYFLSYSNKIIINDIHLFSVSDTLDDIMTESGDEEETEGILNKVLDEIGIEISGKVCKVMQRFTLNKVILFNIF